jgi:hypothetical protein
MEAASFWGMEQSGMNQKIQRTGTILKNKFYFIFFTFVLGEGTYCDNLLDVHLV